MFREELPGHQLNVTQVWPGAILGWHRHEQQDDRMLVIEGIVKVGMWFPEREDQAVWHVLTPREPRELFVVRGCWHGYQNIGTETATVITLVNQPYNPNDELRLDPDTVTHPKLQWTRKNR